MHEPESLHQEEDVVVALIKEHPATRFHVVVTVPEWRQAIVINKWLGPIVRRVIKTILAENADSHAGNR